LICVSLREPDVERLRDALRGLDLAEIRLDLIRLTAAEVKSVFSLPVSLVASFRPGRAGDGERLESLALAIRSGAKYADVEVDSPEGFRREVGAMARSSGCRLIVSHHDDRATPARDTLDDIADRCRTSGADITKIACRVHSPSDCARLLSLYDRPEPMIALGLGELGAFTRVVAPLLGAPFTYASLAPGKETADGQLDRTTLGERIKALTGT